MHYTNGCVYCSLLVSILNMAAAAAQFYFRFRIGCYRCLHKISVYQQIKCSAALQWCL